MCLCVIKANMTLAIVGVYSSLLRVTSCFERLLTDSMDNKETDKPKLAAKVIAKECNNKRS